MIVEGFCSIIFGLIYGLISLIPTSSSFSLPGWATQATALLAKAMIVFPADVWVVVMGNIAFWLIVQMGWAIIEWVYKKIPGVS